MNHRDKRRAKLTRQITFDFPFAHAATDSDSAAPRLTALHPETEPLARIHEMALRRNITPPAYTAAMYDAAANRAVWFMAGDMGITADAGQIRVRDSVMAWISIPGLPGRWSLLSARIWCTPDIAYRFSRNDGDDVFAAIPSDMLGCIAFDEPPETNREHRRQPAPSSN